MAWRKILHSGETFSSEQRVFKEQQGSQQCEQGIQFLDAEVQKAGLDIPVGWQVRLNHLVVVRDTGYRPYSADERANASLALIWSSVTPSAPAMPDTTALSDARSHRVLRSVARKIRRCTVASS